MLQKIDPNHYQAIIFDLGGVLLDIDYQASKRAFEKLGVIDFDAHFSQLSQSHLFDNFECGMISPSDFRKKMMAESNITVTDEELDNAWNAMLLDFPIHRIELLERISKIIPIFLFSNTNIIHIQLFIQRLIKNNSRERFENSFQKIYYSFEMGMRKPHPESFTYIINENRLVASQTLFIDDSEQHIEGAKKAGLQSLLLESNLDVTSIFI